MSVIREVTAEDIPLLTRGLRALAGDIGDAYTLADEDLVKALTGPRPVAHAVLAGQWYPEGLALFTPLVSTSLGHTGAYVSDLWVAPEKRGSGLGPRLLGAVLREAGARWGARYLRLIVYDTNEQALRFYERLGFRRTAEECGMILPVSAGAGLREIL